ncbi:hypothetical protein GGI42DRAFT_323173 [Trichoderma sp. SZMC 28013]
MVFSCSFQPLPVAAIGQQRAFRISADAAEIFWEAVCAAIFSALPFRNSAACDGCNDGREQKHWIVWLPLSLARFDLDEIDARIGGSLVCTFASSLLYCTSDLTQLASVPLSSFNSFRSTALPPSGWPLRNLRCQRTHRPWLWTLSRSAIGLASLSTCCCASTPRRDVGTSRKGVIGEALGLASALEDASHASPCCQ